MSFLDIIKAIIFGIVEGVTEWLPVSSTGHMILLNEIMPLTIGDNPDEFYSMFEVVIQLGAIMAVVILFWDKIWPFGKSEHGKHIPYSKTGFGRYLKKDVFVLWFHIIVSCIPAVIVGLLFDDFFEALFYNYQTVAIMLILVGIAFILVEALYRGRKARIKRIRDISYPMAFIIGLFQMIAAIFPGTSRSGATIIGALIFGVSRKVAAEYTFYLAIPVMFGASLLKIIKYGLAFSFAQVVILIIAMLVAFAVSMFIIRFLMDYIRKHDFKVFGYYRIVLGVIVLICGILGVI